MEKKTFTDIPDGFKRIYRASTTTPNGRRIYAKWYGLRAFVLIVRIDDENYAE